MTDHKKDRQNHQTSKKKKVYADELCVTFYSLVEDMNHPDISFRVSIYMVYIHIYIINTIKKVKFKLYCTSEETVTLNISMLAVNEMCSTALLSNNEGK